MRRIFDIFALLLVAVLLFKAYPGVVHQAMWQSFKHAKPVLLQGQAAMLLGSAYAFVALAILAALTPRIGAPERKANIAAGLCFAACLVTGALSYAVRP